MAVRMLKNADFAESPSSSATSCVFGRKGAAEWFEQGRAFCATVRIVRISPVRQSRKNGQQGLGSWGITVYCLPGLTAERLKR